MKNKIMIMIGKGYEFHEMLFTDLEPDKFYLLGYDKRNEHDVFISIPFDTEAEAEALHQQIMQPLKGNVKLMTHEKHLSARGLELLRKTVLNE